MKEVVEEWRKSLQSAWNSCEIDNDVFVQQALQVMQEMREFVGDVEMFEKG